MVTFINVRFCADVIFNLDLYGVGKMTEKRFTETEINTKTNELMLRYAKHYRDGKMSFAELTLIENVIMRVQLLFHDSGDVE